MFNKLHQSIKLFTKYLWLHPQFLFTLLLLLFIPFAFIYTGQQFLKVSNENQERLEKDKIGVLHDAFIELTKVQSNAPEALQTQILNVVALNPDITKFRIVKAEAGKFQIIAALDQEIIGTFEEQTDLYKYASLEANDTVIFPYYKDDIRYWQSFRSATGENGQQFYIFTETSFEKTDNLFVSKINEAYLWLFWSLLIIVYLAYRHLKLSNYS